MEIRGYNTSSGYMGWTGTKWMLFSCEQDYIEWMKGE